MRDGRLDFFKSFLIWSVVMGHCMNVLCPYHNWIHTALRLFDLPMFMYISGYLLKGSIQRYDYRQLVVNKLTTIAFPAVVWMAISFLLGDPHLYYFLWAILVSSLTVCTCYYVFVKNILLRSVCLILIAILFHFIPKNIVNISFLYPFFIIGYFSKDISHVGWKKGIVSLSLFLFLLIFLWRPEFTIWYSGGYVLNNTYHMIYVVLLRLTIGLTGIYTATYVMGKLYNWFKDNPTMKICSNIGKETLAIYLMQHIVVEILLLKLVNLLEISDELSYYYVVIGYLLCPIISLILLLIMYGIVSFIQTRRYMKCLFGFKVQLSPKV